jgi:S1-C subfamily serine protease
MRTWKNVLVVGVVVLALALSTSAARADIPLGIFVAETPNGIVVTDVIQGGIADRCMPRLRRGARIVTVNGDPIKSAEQFQRILEASDFVRFQFVDPTGELRWARAWSSPRILLNCRP